MEVNPVRVNSPRPKSPRYPEGSLSPATRGAVAELVACINLVNDGYEVFRAVSPSCSCDLIAQKSGQMFRVEVRTGTLTPTGKRYFPAYGQYDMLIVVYPDGTVEKHE